ncbi:ATP-binding protein [Streptomyces sp. XM83C]|jgi:signal transduction histidine kinase|uniref:sensor histidine kinase n=1 Tax=unclassified Streptomyces TaxID=2593676 RepID=UPI001FF866DC|nr:ATP-binding protein [Streptomyces sp. XM83C]MCK1822405.1 ATP-binding protein [Streptomyces sp. XM83C]
MSANAGPRPDRRAAVVESALAAYAAGLRDADSALVRDERVWNSARGQARDILTECLAALHGEQVQVAMEAELTSMALGMRRAFEQIPPIDSLFAAYLLFEVGTDALVEEARALSADTAMDRLTRAVRMLHSSISTRVRAGAIGYEASTLRGVGEANTARRDQLARDIHDHIGSSLSLALRCLDLYEADLAAGGSAHTRIADARKALRDTFRFTRSLVSGLRSYELRDSLHAEINSYTQAVADGAQVAVGINGDEAWLPADRRREIFLVVRECLRNAFTHAAASRIDVDVTIAPDSVACTVEDDGRGFDASGAASGGSGGMSSMRERVHGLGGALRVASYPGIGTRVHFQVPLPQPARAGGSVEAREHT